MHGIIECSGVANAGDLATVIYNCAGHYGMLQCRIATDITSNAGDDAGEKYKIAPVVRLGQLTRCACLQYLSYHVRMHCQVRSPSL